MFRFHRWNVKQSLFVCDMANVRSLDRSIFFSIAHTERERDRKRKNERQTLSLYLTQDISSLPTLFISNQLTEIILNCNWMLNFNDPFIAGFMHIVWMHLGASQLNRIESNWVEKPQRLFKVVSNGFDKMQLFSFGIQIYSLIICNTWTLGVRKFSRAGTGAWMLAYSLR